MRAEAFIGGGWLVVIERMVAKARRGSERVAKSLHGRQAAPGGRLVLDIDRYGGKWIATRQGAVVADGDSYSEVAAAVDRLGLRDQVILTLVPTTGAIVL